MNTYKLSLQYNGTQYSGWQKQPDQKTIQGELNKVLETICKSSQIKSIGSGRTDAGVHAHEQVVKIEIPLELSCEALHLGINSLIETDIKINTVEKCSADFHPTYHAISKEYVYLFSTDKIQSPFIKDFVAQYPYELDLKKMQMACEAFIGEYDFLGFSTKGTDVKTTIRKIFDCKVEKSQDDFLGEHYRFSVEGSGFLKQMVRLMVGAVLDIGRGKLDVKDIQDLLASGEDRKISSVAPPNGLYLNFVKYE